MPCPAKPHPPPALCPASDREVRRPFAGQHTCLLGMDLGQILPCRRVLVTHCGPHLSCSNPSTVNSVDHLHSSMLGQLEKKRHPKIGRPRPFHTLLLSALMLNGRELPLSCCFCPSLGCSWFQVLGTILNSWIRTCVVITKTVISPLSVQGCTRPGLIDPFSE